MQSTTNIAVRPKISSRYEDPLDIVWVSAAQAMGMTVVRDPHVFASWDGQGVLRIGVPESLDPDDCLAQMILHEVCHALVEGPVAFGKPDWGLRIDDPAQRYREHACLRLQAALADVHGLRQFFAATTAFREYFDRLPADPLQACDDPAVAPALAGYRRATEGPWADPLNDAFRATAEIASVARRFAGPESLWKAALPRT